MNLTIPYIPRMVTRQEALDITTCEIFASNGFNDTERAEILKDAYKALQECPDSFFEENFSSFEVFSLDEYETKIYLREVAYYQANIDGMIEDMVMDRCVRVLYDIDVLLYEVIDFRQSVYVDIDMLTAIPF
jgi:hypothetical protein